MKKFIEEYGTAILTAIVVIMLLVLTTPVGTAIGNSVKSLVNNFGETANNVMDKSPILGGASETEEPALSENIFTYEDNGDNTITITGIKNEYKRRLTDDEAFEYYLGLGTPEDEIADMLETRRNEEAQHFDSWEEVKEFWNPDATIDEVKAEVKECLLVTTLDELNEIFDYETLSDVTTADGIFLSTVTNITIPNSIDDKTVTSIAEEAFATSNIISLTLPATLETIGQQAFDSCEKLTSITYLGTKAQWKTVVKETFWANCVPATVVHCTDGDVNI